MLASTCLYSLYAWFCLQQKVATVDERLAISDLTPSTQYEVSVLAVGKTGTSWPSSPLTFITYPISNSGTQSSSQQQQQQQPFYGPLSGTTRVSRNQKKNSPTHHPDHHPIFISFFHLPQSLFKLRAWQSFRTTSLQVLFGLPLGLEPST